MAKLTVDQCQRLSVDDLAGKAALATQASGPMQHATAVVTIARPGGEETEQAVELVAHPMRFGGWRWWLICGGCFQRADALYLPPGREVLACRKCHRLCYRSQREKPPRVDGPHGHDRIRAAMLKQMDKANKRREKACGVRIKTSTSDKQTKT